MKIPLLTVGLGLLSSSAVHGAKSREELYFEALKEIDFDEVEKDIIAVMKDSKDFFPADYGHYGPFFIRQAWHCAGSYRISDGEGGCTGGRQRFDPERSWDDNTNLDKPKRLLAPIKEKYGLGLSWGDLITLTGTVAIKDMGGPVLGFCAGRLDDIDGSESEILGPNELQEEVSPCALVGNCISESPLATNIVGLIYVDPAGFLGVPEPDNSVEPIKETFGRMGMNISETVALIGGGHAFGKTHGACTTGAGPSPKQDPENPWPGTCGAGVTNVFTSGFEGPWTSTPTRYSNNFFRALKNFNFTLFEEGPGGKPYFVIDEENTAGEIPRAPSPDVTSSDTQHLLMLTTDLALTRDPAFQEFVDKFAADINELSFHFSHAWYKLMTRDMGPVTRCFGNNIPDAQEFQAPLPAPKNGFPSARKVASVVNEKLKEPIENFGSDTDSKTGDDYAGAAIVEAAFLCAATFRDSDKHGGCNGARIRLSPEIDWEDRAPLKPVLEFLSDAKTKAGDLTEADFLVFAASQALQVASDNKLDLKFCPGRSDATDAPISAQLKLFTYNNKIIEQQRQARLLGLSNLEYVAISGRPRSPTYMKALGYQGSYTDDVATFTNSYAKILLANTWTRVAETENLPLGQEFQNADGTLFITERDFVFTIDDDFLAPLFELAASEEFFLQTFSGAWTKVMNNDRFDGPVFNECEDGKIQLIDLAEALQSPASNTQSSLAGLVLVVIALLGLN